MMRCESRPECRRPHLRGGAAGVLAAMLFFGILPRGARADDPVTPSQPGDSISTEGGYAWPARALGTTGRGFTASVIYGHPFLPHFSFEVNLHGSIFETGVPGGTDFYQKGLNLDLVYSLNPLQSYFVNPFLLAGIGGAYDDFNPDNLEIGRAHV